MSSPEPERRRRRRRRKRGQGDGRPATSQGRRPVAVSHERPASAPSRPRNRGGRGGGGRSESRPRRGQRGGARGGRRGGSGRLRGRGGGSGKEGVHHHVRAGHSLRVAYTTACRQRGVARPDARFMDTVESGDLTLAFDKVSGKEAWEAIRESLSGELGAAAVRSLAITSGTAVVVDGVTVTDPEHRQVRLGAASEVARAVSALIKAGGQLASVDLRGVLLSSKAVATICRGLSAAAGPDLSALTSLSLADTRIGDEAVGPLCSALRRATTVSRLCLAGCDLTDRGGHEVVQLLQAHSIARQTDAWAYGLRDGAAGRDSGGGVVVGVLLLDLANNPCIGSETAAGIADVLHNDHWVREINLRACGVDEVGALALVAALEDNTAVVYLDLQLNPDVAVNHLERIDGLLARNTRKRSKAAAEGPSGVSDGGLPAADDTLPAADDTNKAAAPPTAAIAVADQSAPSGVVAADGDLPPLQPAVYPTSGESQLLISMMQDFNARLEEESRARQAYEDRLAALAQQNQHLAAASLLESNDAGSDGVPPLTSARAGVALATLLDSVDQGVIGSVQLEQDPKLLGLLEQTFASFHAFLDRLEAATTSAVAGGAAAGSDESSGGGPASLPPGQPV